MEQKQNRVDTEVKTQTTAQTTTKQIQPAPKQENLPTEHQLEDTSNTEVAAQKKFLELVKNGSNPEGKTMVEVGKELLNVASMSNLMTNEEFREAYQEEQKKQIINELKEQGKIEAIKNGAKKQENRNLRNDSFYKAFKPFFKNFMGIDEAFGLIPMLVSVLFFYIPYIIISLVITVIKYTFIGVNQIFSAVTEFKKPAKNLCMIIIWLAIAIGIVLALIYGAQALFKFKII